MRFIFDLDGTVIDSSHRLGDSLDDWCRLNTADNIAAVGAVGALATERVWRSRAHAAITFSRQRCARQRRRGGHHARVLRLAVQ